jgi:hypothetical protein
MTPADVAAAAYVARMAARHVGLCAGCKRPIVARDAGWAAGSSCLLCPRCLDLQTLDAMVLDLERDPRVGTSPDFRAWRSKYVAFRRRGSPFVGEYISTDTAVSKAKDVDAKVNQTEDFYVKAALKKKVAPDLFKNWSTFATRWRRWYQDYGPEKVVLDLSAADRYTTAEKFDAERWDLEQLLRTKSPDSVTTPASTKPTVGPQGEDPVGGLAGSISKAALSLAVLVGALYVLAGRIKS